MSLDLILLRSEVTPISTLSLAISENELITYLNKISDEILYAYNVYQIEGEGRALFSKIDGDEDTIMGLPIKKIKEYLELQK